MKLFKIFVIICSFSNYAFPQDKYDSEIISYSSYFIITHDKLIETIQLVKQINNRRGASAGKFYIPYNKSIEKISNLEAWIEDKHGNVIRKLKKKEITDISAISDYSFYEDEMVKKFELIHNQFPYKVCCNYTLEKSGFFYITHWSPCYESDIPIKTAKLTIETPRDYQINIYEYNIDGYKTDTTENTIIYYWKGSYEEVIKEEIFAPLIQTQLPNVRICPKYFVYGMEGSNESWISFGNWKCNLIDGLNDLPENEKLKVLKMTKNASDDLEKIKILYYYLQDNTRYINVSIEIGGMKPYPASYVAYNKYGDCKALTNYMKSLLEAVNIQSYYSNVYRGTYHIPVINNFPSQQFNHVLLYVPLESDTLWLECTNKNDPLGYIGTDIQARNAFIVERDHSRLIKTPVHSPADQKVKRDIVLSNITGECNVEINLTARGYTYDWLNYIHTKLSKNDQKNEVQKFIPFKNYTFTDWNISKPSRDSAIITLYANITLNGFAKKYGDSYLIEPVFSDIPDFEKPENRHLPVQINYPIHKIDSIIIHIPRGYEFKPDQDIHIYSKYGRYSVNFTIKDDYVIIERSFLLYRQEIPIDNYSDFYIFINNLKDTEANAIVMLTKK
ncbi:MAG: DUF3857 domain-containing protein [Bacteroidales bacterium]|nr:DUF3857 domain-containing protein [Bacteroidales bacterium]